MRAYTSLVLLFGLATGVARAIDVPVVPTKLIVVDKLAAAGKAKVVFVAKDSAVTKGTGLDVEQVGVRFTVAYGNDATTGGFTIPEGTVNGWLVNKETVAKFVNKDSPAGPTQTKVAVVKPGTLVKIVAKGLGDAPIDVLGAGDPAGPVYTAYCVDNAGEETCHCSELTGCTWTAIAGGTGAKLVCKAGAGDAACQADPATSCEDGDAVCPAGCGLGNDDDCMSCFVDLGLTVLDTCTNLEWEKKNGDDGTPGTGTVNAANLQDVDNRYAWAGKCTLTSFVYCQPNAAAAATCAAQAGAAVNGCGLCGMDDGTCDVQALSGPGVVAITTVWDWLNQLNAAAFAGHGDWRLATTAGTVAIPTGLPSELESIRDVTLGLCGGGSGACIDPVFGPTAIGVFGTYWSGVPFAPPTSDRAWHVEFDDDIVDFVEKTIALQVRAVRAAP